MTAVAAQLCGKPDSRFKMELEHTFEVAGLPLPQWGERFCIAGDLSPAAVFIAANLNLPLDSDRFKRAVKSFHEELAEECSWMYQTRHSDGRLGRIHATVWSDVFVCGQCGRDIVFWDAAVNIASKKVHEVFPCPHCGARRLLKNPPLEKPHRADAPLLTSWRPESGK